MSIFYCEHWASNTANQQKYHSAIFPCFDGMNPYVSEVGKSWKVMVSFPAIVLKVDIVYEESKYSVTMF